MRIIKPGRAVWVLVVSAFVLAACGGSGAANHNGAGLHGIAGIHQPDFDETGTR